MSKKPNSSSRAGRRGLGRGLGALIPDGAQSQEPDIARPLDVLFPNLTGDEHQDAARGGSARALLSPTDTHSPAAMPRRSPAVVSRETKSGEELPANSGSEVSDSLSSNVSRETNWEKAVSGGASDEDLVSVPGTSFTQVPPAWIMPNMMQPRQIFAVEELSELADSIEQVGVLQPLVVRPITADYLDKFGNSDELRRALEEHPEARFELIMGERRWRASQQAGLGAVPVIVRNTEDDELLREALIENLHRVQLNPLEEAAAYEQLMQDFNNTQEELAKKVAKSRPQIANTLRLLRLPSKVQQQVAAGMLSAGHARALLSLPKTTQMEEVARRIIREGMSVRAAEEVVRLNLGASGASPSQKKTATKATDKHLGEAAELAGYLDTNVKITAGSAKGRIVIEFADQEDLHRILALITPPERKSSR